MWVTERYRIKEDAIRRLEHVKKQTHDYAYYEQGKEFIVRYNRKLIKMVRGRRKIVWLNI